MKAGRIVMIVIGSLLALMGSVCSPGEPPG